MCPSKTGVVVHAPTEFVHQGTERERGVRHASGDDDVGTTVECLNDARAADVTVGGQDLAVDVGQRRTRLDGGHTQVAVELIVLSSPVTHAI